MLRVLIKGGKKALKTSSQFDLPLLDIGNIPLPLFPYFIPFPMLYAVFMLAAFFTCIKSELVLVDIAEFMPFAMVLLSVHRYYCILNTLCIQFKNNHLNLKPEAFLLTIIKKVYMMNWILFINSLASPASM